MTRNNILISFIIFKHSIKDTISGINNKDPEQLPATFLIPLFSPCRLAPVGFAAGCPGG
jgi:hypothetical protein